jgi:dihydrofolate reductase
LESVGALVMGSSTYGWVVRNHPGDWMYEQPTWVLTHRPEIIVDGQPVQAFSGEVTKLHSELVSKAAGKDIWVVGGGAAAGQFVAAGLVDELIVTYAPCSPGSGARLLPVRSEWRLAEAAVNGEFVGARWVRAG